MIRLRRRLILLSILPLLAGWMFGSGPAPIHASCAVLPSPETALKQSDAVFSGIVLSVEETNRSGVRSSADPVKVTFRVTRVWKGVESDRVTVRTTAGDAGNYRMAADRELIVYADNTWLGLSVGACTRTADLALAADDLAFLGEGTVPPPAAGSGTMLPDSAAGRLLFVCAAFAALSAAALALFPRLKRRR